MISLRKHNRNLEFWHSLMYTNCYIATQFTQFSTTSNSYKMPCIRHFITFSVFGVSISLKCSFVQAQSQFRLLTFTSLYYLFQQCFTWNIAENFFMSNILCIGKGKTKCIKEHETLENIWIYIVLMKCKKVR